MWTSRVAKETTSCDAVELAFVLAPGQNLFFAELVDALRREVAAAGGRASVHSGSFPPPRPDMVYVLVPPHEYFTLMHGRLGASHDTLKRTIFICAEQPGTDFFEQNVALAPRGGAVFDISQHAARAFKARGIDAHHLQLGWTAPWDHFRERERDIDVLFMGCLSERREQALADYASLLWPRRTRLILSDNSRPNWAPSGSYVADDEKWDLLGRAKIILNVHQGDSPYFEWLRTLQAISNGAVVVTEHSIGYEPLVAGRHFLTGEIRSLGLLTQLMLEDEGRRCRMQADAYETVRCGLRLESSVRELVAVARDVAARPASPDPRDPFFRQPAPGTADLALFSEAAQPPAVSGGDPNAATLRRATKQVQLELLDIRRHLSSLELGVARGSVAPRVELVRRTSAYAAVRPRVSILMALYNYESEVAEAIGSLFASHERSWELIIVDDGSTDRSARVAENWLTRHQEQSALLLRHPVNRGLGPARNTALAWARGDYSFVLDADNEIYPHCLERLIEALETDPGAAFAYGILEQFRGGNPIGLTNTLPWDPSRFRTGNYIDAMALLRTSLVRRRFGGYTTDRRLYGWEDYDLWCKLAEANLRGVFVPEVVARYRSTEHSMLSMTNVSSTEAFSVLIERYPAVMGGLIPPQ